MPNKKLPNVITIDGPSGVGKGTIAKRVADHLGWHYLDSGAIYRVVAWAVSRYPIDPKDESALVELTHQLDIKMIFKSPHEEVTVYCNQENITNQIRTPTCARIASEISSVPRLRNALLQLQRQMRKLPGLVTDGRDMGTVVFPDAIAKFYFIAEAQERAKRRHKQLKEKEISVSLPDIEKEINKRDHRDETRDVSPSKPAKDVVMIDTTNLSIDEVFEKVMDEIHRRIG